MKLFIAQNSKCPCNTKESIHQQRYRAISCNKYIDMTDRNVNGLVPLAGASKNMKCKSLTLHYEVYNNFSSIKLLKHIENAKKIETKLIFRSVIGSLLRMDHSSIMNGQYSMNKYQTNNY